MKTGKRYSQKNPVAKFLPKFNKPQVEQNKKYKLKNGYSKHKEDVYEQ